MDSETGIIVPHLLILEDDTTHQDLALRAFSDDPDPFRMSVVGTVHEARQVIERDPPDLIIADWRLPDGKGLDILPLKDGVVTKPLIIMTGYGDEHLAVEIIKAGAVDYLVKSTTIFQDLPHIARRALDAWENSQQRKLAEQALHTSEGRLRLALEGAGATFWDWHIPSGEVTFSDKFYTQLGYNPGEFPLTYDAWVDLIHPDDRNRVLPDLKQQILEKRPLCEIEYRLLTREGNWVWTLGRGKITETDEQGDPVRLTGINIDITNRMLMESEIRSLNAVLEARVKDRTEVLSKTNEALEEENARRINVEKKLQASYDEKILLLKEVHHRVKNNLQIIVSLLNLQSRYIRDEPTLTVIRESQNRIRAMALVHERLYKAEDISHIILDDYIRFLGEEILISYDAKSRGIQFMQDIRDIFVDINTAIPLGLIINELISNSLKHAFPEGRNGMISIECTLHNGGTLRIVYGDNGVGFPDGLDWKKTNSLGLRLVNSLVDQLNGTIDLVPGEGSTFIINIQASHAGRTGEGATLAIEGPPE